MALSLPASTSTSAGFSRQDVGNAYRLFLGRDPEVEAVVAEKEGSAADDIIRAFLGSTEFETEVAMPVISGRSFAEDRFRADHTSRVNLWMVQRFGISGAARELVLGARSWRQALAAYLRDPAVVRAFPDVQRGWSFAQVSEALLATRGSVADFLSKELRRRSPLANADWLRFCGCDPAEGVERLVERSQQPGFSLTPLFDAAWYRGQASLPPSTSYLDAFSHYLSDGERMGFSPNPFFDVDRYLNFHMDLADALRGGGLKSVLEHFAATEVQERRARALHFDQDYYLSQGPLKIDGVEAAVAGLTPFQHYIQVGWRHGLAPNPVFDEDWYLRNAPLAMREIEAGLYPNAFSHFVVKGQKAGLSPSPFFDQVVYLRCNADAAAEVAARRLADPFQHYWSAGRHEGRRADEEGRSAALSPFFRIALPGGADALVDGRLLRLDSTPTQVLHRARRPAPGGLLRDLFVRAVGAPGTDADRKDVQRALLLAGSPRISIEHGARQTVFEGAVYRLFVSGYADLPLAKLASIATLAERDPDASGFLLYPRLDGVKEAAALGAGEEGLTVGYLFWFDFDAQGVPPGELTVGLTFDFEVDGERRTHAGPAVLVDILPLPGRSSATNAVQVAMATYNPAKEPFERQVESIRAQTGNAPALLISDDASRSVGVRAVLSARAEPNVEVALNARNVGFAVNFERALHMVSPAAQTILLSDQDDVWLPQKVQRLQALLQEPGAVCAFSDMRIVSEHGEEIASTFWEGRDVHHEDSVSLAVANTVTGAASAFGRPLLDRLLPFPRNFGLYHDQWLSVLAAALGRVAYSKEPLYDYIQHQGNVLGFGGSRGGEAPKWRALLRALRRLSRKAPPQWTDRDIAQVRIGVANWFVVMQRFILLSEALRRVPEWSDPRTQRVAELACRAAAGEDVDLPSLKREWLRLKRRSGGDDALLGIDYRLEASLAAVRLLRRPGMLSLLASTAKLQQVAGETQTRFWARTDLGDYEKKTAPIKVCIRDDACRRVNIFLPELRLSTFYGGYHSKISLAKRLIASGWKVRLVLIDQAIVDYNEIFEIGGAFPELIEAFDRAEIVPAGDRERPLEISVGEGLLATTWWSAHIVDGVREALGHARFVYFVQEYEPFTFSLGTWYRGAEQSYDLPYFGVYSTEIMENFFVRRRIGQFGLDQPDTREHLTFSNPIVGLGDMRRSPASARPRRLLFYARPQHHAARNMYEFGLAALRAAAATLGPELDGWEILGVGADIETEIPLHGDHKLKLVRKMDARTYRRALASSDVGLVLMYTPHPSLVPIEMAAAGLWTVTNTCMDKTAAAIEAISPRLIAAEPDVKSLTQALVTAVRRAPNDQARLDPVDWPSSPETAFPDAWIGRLGDLLERAALGTTQRTSERA